MTTCEQYDELIWDAAETGVIPPTLREHLDACPACRKRLAGVQEAMGGFAALRQIPDHVPAVTIPQHGAASWWPRVAIAAGFMAMLAAAYAVTVYVVPGLQAKKPPIVIKQPVQQHVVLPSPSPIVPVVQPPVREQPVQPPAPAVTPAPGQQPRRDVVKQILPVPAPVPLKKEQQPASPVQQPPASEMVSLDMLISAQPVNGLTPLAATALPARALTAVADLPLAYAITPVDAAEVNRLLGGSVTEPAPDNRTEFVPRGGTRS